MLNNDLFNLKIINPLEFTGWNKLLINTEDYSFFHSSYWAEVLYQTYNFKLNSFVLLDKDRFLFMLPVMEVDNIFGLKKGVSLPFTDYCYPVIDSKIDFNNIFSQVINYAKNSGWESMEIKGGDFTDKSTSVFIRHGLHLDSDESVIFNNIRNNYRSKIRHALKNNLEIRFENSLESVKVYYNLHCLTRRNKGLPPQPFRLFENIYEYILSKNLGFIILASHNKKRIAGAMFLNFGKKGVYKFGASDIQYSDLNANYLIFWSAIKWYCQNGFKHLCFGRTNINNSGLMQFKDGWNTKKANLNYHTYDLTKNKFIDSNKKYNKEMGLSLFKLMPLSILKLTGKILYKYLA